MGNGPKGPDTWGNQMKKKWKGHNRIDEVILEHKYCFEGNK